MPAHHFPAAPWPTALKVTSALASLLLLGVGYGAIRVVPPAGVARGVGIAVACALPGVALGSLLFVVRGYDVEVTRLRVRRLLWSTQIPLDGLTEAVPDPAGAVVLRLPGCTVVVTPRAPHVFLHHLSALFPHARTATTHDG